MVVNGVTSGQGAYNIPVFSPGFEHVPRTVRKTRATLTGAYVRSAHNDDTNRDKSFTSVKLKTARWTTQVGRCVMNLAFLLFQGLGVRQHRPARRQRCWRMWIPINGDTQDIEIKRRYEGNQSYKYGIWI